MKDSTNRCSCAYRDQVGQQFSGELGFLYTGTIRFFSTPPLSAACIASSNFGSG